MPTKMSKIGFHAKLARTADGYCINIPLKTKQDHPELQSNYEDKILFYVVMERVTPGLDPQ